MMGFGVLVTGLQVVMHVVEDANQGGWVVG